MCLALLQKVVVNYNGLYFVLWVHQCLKLQQCTLHQRCTDLRGCAPIVYTCIDYTGNAVGDIKLT